MHTILIVIHLLIVLALVGIVLVQRSEGGGLGIGGGSGFMTARGAANTLTRTTGFLAAAFFATSLALGILARYGTGPTDILDRIPASQEQQAPDSSQGGGTLLDDLGGSVSSDTQSGDENAPTNDANGASGVPSSSEPAQSQESGNDAASRDAAPAGDSGAEDAKPQDGSTDRQSGGNAGQQTDDGGSQSQIPTGQ